MQGNFYGWVHITADCFYFNVLKFELQYEWTPPLIFFCGYRVLQQFCDNVGRAHDIKCIQKQLELKFCWFQRLGSNFTRDSHRRSSINIMSKRLLHRGFPVNFARFLRIPFLRGTSGWLLLFYNSCWLYILHWYIASNF